MLKSKNLGIHKIYRVNVCSVHKKDINICFFFIYYITPTGNYEFRNTRAFPTHWKKHLSKKLIDYLSTLEYYYWFSFSNNRGFNHVEDIKLKEKICEQFILYSPININIREYNV